MIGGVTDRPCVLVVDDDDGIREMLQSALTFGGFDVRCAPDGVTALQLLGAQDVDAVVLDVLMPGLDGFDLMQLLRHRGNNIPVLFLSARDAVEDRVRGLRLGGDDYLTKPFSLVEVVARLESLLRRAQVTAGAAIDGDGQGRLRCADLELDEARHRVSRSGVAIELSPTEFRLLACLMRNQGRVLSKSQILEHVWQYDFGGEANVVERFVSRLRRKIEADGPPLLRTVRGFGYTIRCDGQ
jgi:two-component system, OmpR family, response regulator